MKEGLLTRDIVFRALDLTRPSIIAILSRDFAIWGPSWVSIYINGPGLQKPFFALINAGDSECKWKKEWGEEKNFGVIARHKLNLAQRTGMRTSLLASQCPWVFQEGDFFYPGGVAKEKNGLVVATSGARGETDEGISDIIYVTIEMLCRIKIKEMQDSGRDQV